MATYSHESPAARRNRREFTRFSRALTSSLPSRLARRDAKSSIAAHNTCAYMASADALLKDRARKPPAPTARLPPRFLTLLSLQVASGKEKGQWRKSPELVELLGGYVPNAPKGVTEWRWWTALAMAFLRRHPHLHDKVREAYERAEFWVPDPWLLRTARDAEESAAHLKEDARTRMEDSRRKTEEAYRLDRVAEEKEREAKMIRGRLMAILQVRVFRLLRGLHVESHVMVARHPVVRGPM